MRVIKEKKRRRFQKRKFMSKPLFRSRSSQTWIKHKITIHIQSKTFITKPIPTCTNSLKAQSTLLLLPLERLAAVYFIEFYLNKIHSFYKVRFQVSVQRIIILNLQRTSPLRIFWKFENYPTLATPFFSILLPKSQISNKTIYYFEFKFFIMSQHSQSSFTLQQSLSESIKESREKVSSLRSDSNTNSLLLQSRVTQDQTTPHLILDKSNICLWRSLVETIKNPSAHYFFEVQKQIDELFLSLNNNQFNQFHQIIGTLYQNLEKVKKGLHPQNFYLYEGTLKALSMFNDSIDPFKIQYMGEFDTLQLYENLQIISDTFANLGVSHFLSQEGEEGSDPNLEISIDDSQSSDFSDDNYDIEEFERESTLQIIQKMKKQLIRKEIYEECKQFKFTSQNLREFFTDAMKLDSFSNIELLWFTNNTGITLKLLQLKKSQESVKEFIILLQQAINKILNSSPQHIKQFVEENSFEFRYAKFSKGSFFSKKNLLQEIQKQVIQGKIPSELQYLNKRDFRLKVVQMSVPINRFETHMYGWLQSCQQVVSKKKQSIREMIILFYPNQEPLLEIMNDVDMKKNGLVNVKQFFQWVKRAQIPSSYKEARELFHEFSCVIGQETLEGVVAEKLCNYQDMLDEVYGVQREKKSELVEKYSNGNLNRQKVGIQRNQIANLKQQLNQCFLSLENECHKNKELEEVISQNNQNLANLEEEMKRLKQQNQQKLLQFDLENNSRLSNLKNETRNEMVVKYKRWEVEKQEMNELLSHKDRQIEAYRMEIESILNEMATMRLMTQS